ncbi:hypothetical protein NP233_g2724 [Leucocoprinus birnbaumii]|uniref:Uncharacterized protein n=1 Tax=Leucocoprinus birnbaumii TaxID=56174 RepID=A0AAD5YYV2_9AGAR|nr:hypothetical protein NP233_g2724 [Leucocoprinus birnbaumii]
MTLATTTVPIDNACGNGACKAQDNCKCSAGASYAHIEPFRLRCFNGVLCALLLWLEENGTKDDFAKGMEEFVTQFVQSQEHEYDMMNVLAT